MELKIEDIKIGTKLELVEEELQKATKPFVLGWLDYMRSQKEIIVTGLEDDMLEVNHNEDWGISEDSIGYFKKKEKPQQYTFDDLIDVAVQAFKDGIISDLDIRSHYIQFRYDSKIFFETDNDKGVKFIQSLYKETFVIECEKDLKKIKDTAQITMPNKEILDYKDAISLERYTNSFILKLLKGATVEQSK